MADGKNAGTPWTAEEVAELKRLAKENTPTPLIANKLGRTEASIQSKAEAENISLKPVNRSPYG